MNIANFKGTKYKTLKIDTLDQYFENLLTIYKKSNPKNAEILQNKYKKNNRKIHKGKILYELLFKMNTEKIDKKRWIYNQSGENLQLKDFVN